MSIFDFCTLPQGVVETLLVPYSGFDGKKIHEAAKDQGRDLGRAAASLVMSAGLMAAGGVAGRVGARASHAARLYQPLKNIIQDNVEFYELVKENPRETLIDFAKFLGESFISTSPLYGPQGVFLGPLMLMNGPLRGFESWNPVEDIIDTWRCGMTLATLSVYPGDSSCDRSVPKLDITTEEVKEGAIEVLKMAVPILGIL